MYHNAKHLESRIAMTLLVIYISIALGVSFLCSVMEAVLLSVTPGFVSANMIQNPPFGNRLKELKEDVERPLAAILSLNTIAHTVGAAGAGAQAAAVFGDAFVGVISAVLTFLILVLSEIIPKTLGAVYWRTLAKPVVWLLRPVLWTMWPLVLMAKGLTRLLAPAGKRAQISREEFLALTDLGVHEGVVSAEDSRILKNVLQLQNLTAKDIMTPRTVVFSLPESMTVREVLDQHPDIIFSRIPVYHQNRDQVSGFVLKQDIFRLAAKDEHDVPLESFRRPVDMVDDTTPLNQLLDTFLATRNHLALVVDSYGGLRGIVTLEDLMETLLGLEIMDEVDTVEDMQAFARQQWHKRAEKLGLPVNQTDTDNRL